jgi:hypothetical protein
LQCPPPPPSGTCWETSTMQCTGQACSPDHPCSQSTQRCVPQCPPPTPISQCANVPCGGPCVISPPCPPSGPCPERASLLGHCTVDAAGSCQCVPASPGPTRTPPPTPTPQCDSVPCGGPCVMSFPPFPCPGPVCNGTQGPDVPVQKGQCVLTAAGSCDCVPVSTPTPRATPMPQCSSAPCGGACIISLCPPGALCPAIASLLGQCTADATGGCQCVPVSPGPTHTPTATPTPQCSRGGCGGPCVISPPCPFGMVCPNFVQQGACQADSSGSCQCVPVGPPTPMPTPSPGFAHGHTCCECPNQGEACVDFAWVKDPRACPFGCVTQINAECESACGPGPQGGSATCVALTPCTTDQDCDDGNPCTVDRCTIDGCTHACLCV